MATELKERAMLAVVDRAAKVGGTSLVLRGGLVTRELIAPIRRPVDDVDFLALCSESEAIALLRAITSGEGEPVFSMAEVERIWVETEFPGLRTQCTVRGAGGDVVVQIDVGFGDPRALPDKALQLVGMTTSIAAVCLETMLAWKIHGMFERGDGGWRAKDLVDVNDLAERCADPEGAARCLQLAFRSRGDELSLCERFLHGEWGMSRGSRRKWRQFRRQRAEFDPSRAFPEDLQDFVGTLRRQTAPLIDRARALAGERRIG